MQLTDSEFSGIASFIKQNYGVDLAGKRALVEGRMTSVMAKSGYSTCAELLHRVFQNPQGEEAGVLVNSLTTNHTFFLREEEHFEFLRKTVLPELKEKNKFFKDIGIWSAAASSGEEAFTIAMTIDEFFGTEAKNWDTTILATDISTKVLIAAEHAVYDAERIENLPERWKKNYFLKQNDDKYIVCDKIRKQVLFRRFNLMEEFRFKRKFNIIFLRNVMIYFDEPTKCSLIAKIYDAMEPGGYLFIGTTETLGKARGSFKQLTPSIYVK